MVASDDPEDGGKAQTGAKYSIVKPFACDESILTIPFKNARSIIFDRDIDGPTLSVLCSLKTGSF